MKPKIYTFGYGRDKTLERLRQHLNDLEDAIVVDVRIKPYSRPPWKKQDLKRFLDTRYIHVGELGNVNYKGGPILIKDMEAGAKKVEALMTYFSPILLCVCNDVHQCHRKVVAEELAERTTGVEVVHLGRHQGKLL